MKTVEKENSVTFLVRVQPRTNRDEIAGEDQDALKICLTAPSVADRANRALREFLASRLKVPLTAVRIAAGERSRTKRIEVNGVSAAMLRSLVG